MSTAHPAPPAQLPIERGARTVPDRATVKQVWASLWNFRAYDERDFHRIDHLSAAMGVLAPELRRRAGQRRGRHEEPVRPGLAGLLRQRPGRRVARHEPDPTATPDELLVSAIGEHDEYETQYIRRSSLTTDGTPVMTHEQVAGLTSLLETIQSRFKAIYAKHDDDGFAMDVEFKVDAAGRLAVKQARTWVE